MQEENKSQGIEKNPVVQSVAQSGEKPTLKPAEKPKNGSEDFLAVIRIRGGRRIDGQIKDTLLMLNLANQHNMIIIPNKPSLAGMVKKVKDYVTWGEISPDVKAEVEKTKTEKTSDGKVRKYFRLNPPKGGFERKGIKISFAVGGALGYRGDKINNLIKKMF